MRRIRQHLRSNVIGYIALFFALSTGSAVALSGSNTVFSDDIVNGQVKEPDLAKLTFIPVNPNPVGASDPCDTNQVGIFCGHDSVSGLRGWQNLDRGYAPVKYARDGLGIVHLQGTMYQGIHANDTSFILPPGYRPIGLREFIVAYGQSNTCGGGPCDHRHTLLQVRQSGRVMLPQAQPGTGQNFSEGVSLDGVDFKAG